MNYKILSNKFLLCDTNILINLIKHPEIFKDFLQNLSNENVTLVISTITEIEFIKGAQDNKERESLNKVLNSYEVLPLTNDLISDLKKFSIISNLPKYRSRKIEFGDCFISAEMSKYNKVQQNLYLATMNHSDFPRNFFPSVGFYSTYDEEDTFYNIGIYSFDRKKFLEECSSQTI